MIKRKQILMGLYFGFLCKNVWVWFQGQGCSTPPPPSSSICNSSMVTPFHYHTMLIQIASKVLYNHTMHVGLCCNWNCKYFFVKKYEIILINRPVAFWKIRFFFSVLDYQYNFIYDSEQKIFKNAKRKRKYVSVISVHVAYM